jgi:hypothetical protein
VTNISLNKEVPAEEQEIWDAGISVSSVLWSRLGAVKQRNV